MPNFCLALKILENLQKHLKRIMEEPENTDMKLQALHIVVLNVRKGIVGLGRGDVYILRLN